MSIRRTLSQSRLAWRLAALLALLAASLITAQAQQSASLTATVDTADQTVDLTINNHTGNWWFKINSGSCTAVSGTTVSGISGYKPGTYTVYAYSDSNCATQIAWADFIIPSASLTATVNSDRSVDLSLSNGPSPWYFRIGWGSCTAVTGTTVNGISGYQAGTYSVAAFSGSGCKGLIGSANFIIPVPSPTATLATTVNPGPSVDLTLTNGPSNWWFRINWWGGCTAVSGTNTVNNIQGYQAGTYPVTAYSDSACNTEIASSSFVISELALAIAVDSSDRSIDFTLSGGPNNWWFRIGWWGNCTAAAGTTVSNILGYQSGSYIVAVYPAAGCALGSHITAESFTMPTATLAATVNDDRSVDLTLTNGTSNWWFRINWWGACTAAGGTTVSNIQGYKPGTHYVSAYSDSGCGYHVASSSFTLLPPTLTASGITSTGATLTIANHGGGNWYYKADVGPDSACQGPVSATTKDLTGLTGGTTYTYSAYSDSGCATLIATADSFIAIGFTVSGISDTGATLTIDGHAAQWWYQADTGPDATCQGPVAAGTSTKTLTGLTGDTTYTYKAYSDNACSTANELATAASFTTPSLTASGMTKTGATLTLTGLSSGTNWWLQETAPNTGTCTAGEADFSHALSSLNAGTSYTYKAYSDNACSTAKELASETFATSDSLTATTVGATSATLTLASATHTGNWSVKETSPSTGTCANKTSATHALSSLAAGAVYTYTAYSGSGCTAANEIAGETFATLVTLSNLTTSGTGTVVVDSSGGESAGFVTGGNAGGYTLESVDVRISSVTNTTGNASGDLTVALYTSASNGKPGTSQATLTGSSPTGAGTFTFTCPDSANCSLSPATQYHVVLTAPNTTGNGRYVWSVASTLSATQEPSNNGWFVNVSHYHYSGNWQNVSSANKTKVSAAVDPSLTVSSITATGATLTLSHYAGGAWWHKGSQANASCEPVAAGTFTAALSSLTSGTSYTYKAYDTSSCGSADEIASAAAFTAGSAPTFTAGTPTASKNTLTLANWNGIWSYRHGNSDGVCAPVAAGTTSVNLTGLSVNTSFTYTAYSDGACTAVIAAASEFTTGNPSLSVAFSSSGSDIIAKLTLSGWAAGQGAGKDGIWYYKYTVPTGGTCSFPRSTQQSGNITVEAGTSYTFKAYGGFGGCKSANEIASLTVAVSGPDSVGAQVRDINKNRTVASDDKLQVWWNKPTWASATDSFSYTVDCSTSASAPYTWTSACATVASTTNASSMATVSTTGVTRVRVRGSLGSSTTPWVESDVPSGTAPGTPTNMSYRRLGPPNIRHEVSWSKPASPSGAVGYEVQCRQSNTDWVVCLTKDPTTDATITHSLSTTYWSIRVRSVVDGVVGAWGVIKNG